MLDYPRKRDATSKIDDNRYLQKHLKMKCCAKTRVNIGFPTADCELKMRLSSLSTSARLTGPLRCKDAVKQPLGLTRLRSASMPRTIEGKKKELRRILERSTHYASSVFSRAFLNICFVSS
jgi:hypothetical protein